MHPCDAPVLWVRAGELAPVSLPVVSQSENPVQTSSTPSLHVCDQPMSDNDVHKELPYISPHLFQMVQSSAEGRVGAFVCRSVCPECILMWD